MTGGGHRSLRRDMLPGGIDDLPPGLSADLAILDLDYDRMRRRRAGVAGRSGYSRAVAEAIGAAHELTGGDGICCAISRDVRDEESGALDMLGTKAVDDIGPWTVSDEIIWSTEPPGPWQDLPDGSGRASAFAGGFYQIWVLAKHSPAPSRSAMLARAPLGGDERREAASSVWHIKPEPCGEYDDPVPTRVLARLILSYSDPGGLVLDPFAGYGATALACESLGRGYVCAIDDPGRLAAAKARLRAGAGVAEERQGTGP